MKLHIGNLSRNGNFCWFQCRRVTHNGNSKLMVQWKHCRTHFLVNNVHDMQWKQVISLHIELSKSFHFASNPVSRNGNFCWSPWKDVASIGNWWSNGNFPVPTSLYRNHASSNQNKWFRYMLHFLGVSILHRTLFLGMETFEVLARITLRSHEVTQWKLLLGMETFAVGNKSFHFAHEVPSFRFTGGLR